MSGKSDGRFMLTYSIRNKPFTVKYFDTDEAARAFARSLGKVQWGIFPRVHDTGKKQLNYK